jgi:ATP-dependent DNA ligase
MALPVTRIVLDGEAVAHCPERPAGLQRAPAPLWLRYACLYAFDLLHVGDEDVRGLSLVERRALFRRHLKRAGPAIVYSDHMDGRDGEAMFRTPAPWGSRASSRNASTAGTSPAGPSVG